MESLADFLGTTETPRAADGIEAPREKKLTAKAICRTLLNSKEYRQSLVERILENDLAPAVECKLWEYAYGKPVDRVEVKDTTQRLADLSAEQLEERALKLAQLARQVRESQESQDRPAFDEPEHDSVH